jgi:putative FmdB family regulatory protein
MPTYEYSCQSCGKNFEAFQSMKDAPLKVCVCCGKKGKVRRLVGGGAGLIFKGSGFYITDYKKKGVAPAKEGGKENVKAPPPASSAKTSD